MRTDELAFLLAFDAWATDRVMATAERLSAREFAAEAGPGQVAPRGTLLHCISGMRTWRERLLELPVSAPGIDEGVSTPAAVRSLWRAEHALLEAYVTSAAEAGMATEFEHRRPDRLLRGERWQFVVHLVLHNMQHRSELAQALTLLGHSPGELGLTAYMQESLAERNRYRTEPGSR